MDDKELQNLLFTSVQHHNEALLDDLLSGENGKKLLDLPGHNGKTLLHRAVSENDVRIVNCLLRHGANPNVFDTIKSRTPLHLAIELGHADIVKSFLDLDTINLELHDDRNLSCYDIALFCDNQSLADLIETRIAEINQYRDDFYSVINQACNNNDPKLVKELIESRLKRSVDKLTSNSKLSRLDSEQLALTYIRSLINWSSSSWNDVTLLFKYASKGYTKVCKVLIEYGATAKCNTTTNYSPLYVAAYGGFTDTVKLLLDNFPYLISEITIEKWSILHACCLQGHSETAKFILSYPYTQDLDKTFTTRAGTYEYKFAFDLNAQDAAGQTVIYLAVSANNEKLLDTLLHFKVEAKLLKRVSDQSFTSEQQSNNNAKNTQNNNKPEIRAKIIPDRPKILFGAHDKANSLFSPNSQLDKIIRQLHNTISPNDSHKQSIRSHINRSDKINPTITKTITRLDDHAHDINDDDKIYLLCPFDLDTYCDYNSKTALHLAVCQRYHKIATTLLVNGSNPNLPILPRKLLYTSASSSPQPEQTSDQSQTLTWSRSIPATSKSTCLKEACSLSDETMCDILIRYGAQDHGNLALQEAAKNSKQENRKTSNNLISKFLALNSNVDPEYKINKKCNVEFASRYKISRQQQSSYGNVTTFSSMFPSTPVMIDWQNLKCIGQIEAQWLIDASLHHNKRLKHPTTSLMAITRLDLSSNNLKSVHPVIFRLPSLRELNLSKNRIESLIMDPTNHASRSQHRGSLDTTTTMNNLDDVVSSPKSTSVTMKLIESHRFAMRRSKSTNSSFMAQNLENSNIIDLDEPQEWDLPYLEVFYLHDNRLTGLPDCLFELPKLTELDVSSNQIRQLPSSMWQAPSLREVIASNNLLDDLPRLRNSTIAMRYSTDPNVSSMDSPRASLDSSIGHQHSSSMISRVNTTIDHHHEQQQHAFLLKIDDYTEYQLKSEKKSLVHLNDWKRNLDLVDTPIDSTYLSNLEIVQQQKTSTPKNQLISAKPDRLKLNRISYLNLSHNSFESIPPVLACVAPELSRLNLAHNRMSSLGPICLYPAKLKTLDLSQNQLSSWFSHPTLRSQLNDLVHLMSCQCQCVDMSTSTNQWCIHKSHRRLDHLRSLNLSHNSLREIRLSPESAQVDGPEDNIKNSYYYANITALDLSYNKIHEIPKQLAILKDISVLNFNGNINVMSLPPELGLASKLWNLSLNGCNLSEPLKSIVQSNSHKTMDIIGYLRSILEEAKPYARMKLMLVGLQGIGKTSLLEQMRHEGHSSSSNRRQPEHWTRRMGHSSRNNMRNHTGVTLSTVGVDIHDWTYTKRTAKNEANLGPVSFSTWDFGGQQEFYATHRYFLSKRSIYIVVWRLTDGLPGIYGIQQWLVNIESRASGSPVVIVGTHEDLIEDGETGSAVRRLQTEIHKRFIDVSDHDKCGLPKVMDSIVVSTKTKHNIKQLCARIYDIAFSLRSPGSKELLLKQKIPATYLYLEEIVSNVVHERQQRKLEPVLTYVDYRKLTSERLKVKYNKTFRDLEPLSSKEINYNSELQQATRFLHENGVLLHYEDANLRDLYFLDPQWLCDILSFVVTIREINPHVKNGLMKIDDLSFLFKSVDLNLGGLGGIHSYVINLLNKFEIALTWNSQYLLIPSLLPSSIESIERQQDSSILNKVAPRTRGRSAVRKYNQDGTTTSNHPSSSYRVGGHSSRSTSIGPGAMNLDSKLDADHINVELESQYATNMHRLILLRYLPAGFLARLQSGILSDLSFEDVCSDLQADLLDKSSCQSSLEHLMAERVGSKAGWTCWRSGIQLKLQHESTINSYSPQSGDSKQQVSIPLLNIEEKSTLVDGHESEVHYLVECAQVMSSRDAQQQGPISDDDDDNEYASREAPSDVEVLQSKWIKLDTSQYSNILVIEIPSWRLKISSTRPTLNTMSIEPDHHLMARLLAICVNHIDNLLEDWYPSLGTRFAHTLGGSYLVTRVVPCTKCYELRRSKASKDTQVESRQSRVSSRRTAGSTRPRVKLNFDKTPLDPCSQVMPDDEQVSTIYSFHVESCILAAYNIVDERHDKRFAKTCPGDSSQVLMNTFASLRNSLAGANQVTGNSGLRCPKHGQMSLSCIAPDVIFDDVSPILKIDSTQIDRCKLIGRGTFGFVFRGNLRDSKSRVAADAGHQEIALKLLQPVEPGPDAEPSDVLVYKSIKANWHREPFQCACKSYCTARHEIGILQTIRHSNIVTLIGLCIKPLAIVLELAPLGCLSDILKTYKRSGLRIDPTSVQKSTVQIAKALEFLHQQRIIYRDLKSENILVWSFPSPFSTRPQESQVELKLADYGISRQALSTGNWKGFAGTINFLAPEILRHNGDEEYTEKVDCFSFGMLMYELLTTRAPYKHNEPLRSHLAASDFQNNRPQITTKDLVYPNHMFDLMSVCWSQEPSLRPTASQIVSIAGTPEYMQLYDSVSLSWSHSELSFACPIRYTNGNLDLWMGTKDGRLEVLSSSSSNPRYNNYEQLTFEDKNAQITCMCIMNGRIWMVDANMTFMVMPLCSRQSSEQTSRASHFVNRIQSFKIDSRGQLEGLLIEHMEPVDNHRVIVLLLTNGSLWLLSLDTMSFLPVMTDDISFNCMRVQVSASEQVDFVIQCGHSRAISLIEIADCRLRRYSIIPLTGMSDVDDDDGDNVLDYNQSIEITCITGHLSELWTSAGATIHLWDLADESRCVSRKLDCWKLMPCSESLESINIESYYEQAQLSFVTSIEYSKNQLYVGTSHGCFMVIEASSLKPMIVFRPYECEISILVPLMARNHIVSSSSATQIHTQSNEEPETNLDSLEEQLGNIDNDEVGQLVSLGAGYRDLMRRFVGSLDDSLASDDQSNVAILWSANFSNV